MGYDDKLGKWPRLLVVGESVTTDQAAEILVRTDLMWNSLRYIGSDEQWAEQIRQVAREHGYPEEPESPVFRSDSQSAQTAICDWYDASQRWRDQMDMLGLEYLWTERVVSSWIGGPMGWCDWDGTIGTAVYNVGKWPTVEELTSEWRDISEAFPFLTLIAQCVGNEGADPTAAAQWQIRGGAVEVREGDFDLIRATEEPSFTWREAGCSLEQFRHAVALVARWAAAR